jgi:hypothetical protein
MLGLLGTACYEQNSIISCGFAYGWMTGRLDRRNGRTVQRAPAGQFRCGLSTCSWFDRRRRGQQNEATMSARIVYPTQDRFVALLIATYNIINLPQTPSVPSQGSLISCNIISPVVITGAVSCIQLYLGLSLPLHIFLKILHWSIH